MICAIEAYEMFFVTQCSSGGDSCFYGSCSVNCFVVELPRVQGTSEMCFSEVCVIFLVLAVPATTAV